MYDPTAVTVHTTSRSKIVTDASVLVTFNIAVMLNGRVSDALAAKTPWHAVSLFSNAM